MSEPPVSSPSAPPVSARPRPLVLRILLHPAMALLLFIVLTQVAQERAYPLSNFPMYSNPSEWDDYLYLTDDKGAVLPIARHTGLSAAKMMKIFNNRMKTVGARAESPFFVRTTSSAM